MSFNGGLITFGAGGSGFLPIDPVEELLGSGYIRNEDFIASGFQTAEDIGASGFLTEAEMLASGFVTQDALSAQLVASGFITIEDVNEAIAASGLLEKPSAQIVTSDYTMLPKDGAVFADASAGTLTVTLESAVAASGLTKAVKRTNAGGGGQRVKVFSADGFEGVPSLQTLVLRRRGAAVTVISNGSSWMIV